MYNFVWCFLVTKMGCTSSRTLDTDPNVMYNKPKEEAPKFKEDPVPNGNNNVATANGNLANRSPSTTDRKVMRGDMTLYSDARLEREKRLKEKQLRREARAKEMSSKIMDDKEMLSLVSSRSRQTSRAGSPKTTRSAKTNASSVATDRDVLLSAASLERDHPKPGTSEDYPASGGITDSQDHGQEGNAKAQGNIELVGNNVGYSKSGAEIPSAMTEQVTDNRGNAKT